MAKQDSNRRLPFRFIAPACINADYFCLATVSTVSGSEIWIYSRATYDLDRQNEPPEIYKKLWLDDVASTLILRGTLLVAKGSKRVYCWNIGSTSSDQIIHYKSIPPYGEWLRISYAYGFQNSILSDWPILRAFSDDVRQYHYREAAAQLSPPASLRIYAISTAQQLPRTLPPAILELSGIMRLLQSDGDGNPSLTEFFEDDIPEYVTTGTLVVTCLATSGRYPLFLCIASQNPSGSAP
ncbi:hypothetical protein IFR05_015106 [Cadophora sp. M221]|nr:hypothetical protein IFR05_015106 [Cadophora sp. M221]